MSFATIRVPLEAVIPWELLGLALRIEGETFIPQAEGLGVELTALREDIKQIQETLTDLATKVDQLLTKVEHLRQDLTSFCYDSYNLCGDPRCDGWCRVCQHGEEDYEDDYEEKYCRRGRR